MAHEEYLRRNVIHAAACGSKAAADVSLQRLNARKRPAPKWLVENLEAILHRMPAVIDAVREYRDDALDAPAKLRRNA